MKHPETEVNTPHCTSQHIPTFVLPAIIILHFEPEGVDLHQVGWFEVKTVCLSLGLLYHCHFHGAMSSSSSTFYLFTAIPKSLALRIQLLGICVANFVHLNLMHTANYISSYTVM